MLHYFGATVHHWKRSPLGNVNLIHSKWKSYYVTKTLMQPLAKGGTKKKVNHAYAGLYLYIKQYTWPLRSSS